MKNIKNFAFIVVMFTIQIFAQEHRVPDLEDIKAKTTDSLSAFYFPLLTQLFANHSENLSADDYYYLYYGNAFREDFSGYGSSNDLQEARKLMKEEEPDWQEVFDLLDKALQTDPVNTDILYYYAVALDNSGDEDASNQMYRKLFKLLEVPMSSGDGLKEETAMYVTAIRDEYFILSIYEYEMTSQSLLSGKNGAMDYMEVKKNEDKVKGMYFNISLFFGKF